jgi:hypothetical protein
MPTSLAVLLAMIAAVASIAVYRSIVARREDDALHIADPTGQLNAGQRRMERTLTQIDRLGIGLTAVTVIYAIALFAVSLYNGLMNGSLG